MFKKIGLAVFIICLIGISALLLNIYRHVVPSKYFYIFIAFAGTFIVAEILIYKFIRERFVDRPMIIKFFDLVSFIVLGFFLYLFAIFIYPAK